LDHLIRHSDYKWNLSYSAENKLSIETEVIKEFLLLMDRLIRHSDYKWTLSYSAWKKFFA